MKEMGKRIHDMRTECGLTMEQLGEKLGVGKSAINKWEKGEVEYIKRSYIAQMASIFHCSPAWLMGFEDGEVTLEYTSPGKEPVKALVDQDPIIGESALRAKVLQAAAKIRTENLHAALDVLEALM